MKEYPKKENLRFYKIFSESSWIYIILFAEDSADFVAVEKFITKIDLKISDFHSLAVKFHKQTKVFFYCKDKPTITMMDAKAKYEIISDHTIDIEGIIETIEKELK